MRMEALIEAVAPKRVQRLRPGLTISGISMDSRRVEPGHLFAALPGSHADGSAFVREACRRGAAAILTEHAEALADRPQLVVDHARAALARAARAFYGAPDTQLRLGAVTGTNGKSTVAYLVRHLLRSAGTHCGLLGTIEYDLGSREGEGEGATRPAPLTTPEALDIFAYLRAMAERRCQAAVMEVSSHGLCQRRVEGIAFDAGVFTNLTQDHLDFHRTMEQYRAAKSRLFEQLSSKAVAVLNLDDAAGPHYALRTSAQILGFSTAGHPDAELRARVRAMDIHGTRFEVESPWGSREVRWGMAGEHNVQNALAALGAALALGADSGATFNFDRALSALERFGGVPGRLESVGGDALPFRVLVDYAHTGGALRSVMRTLRSLRPSRLIVVFGCGGDRDRGKRPKMGRAVEELADLGVITSDNPRSEDPRAIIADICSGLQRQSKFIVEPGRARAIGLAIREARPGDVVLIAGKGHEDYQIVGSEKHPFDDRRQARLALERRFGHQIPA